MGIQKMYGCDGPDCDEVTAHIKGERKPKGWTRVTIGEGPDAQAGSFHNATCAHAFLDQHLGSARTAPAAGDKS